MSPTIRWLARGMRELPLSANWLSPAESACLATFRFRKRRTEMRLVRWTANRAIATALDFGDDPAALARIELWPAPTGALRPFIADVPASVSVSSPTGLTGPAALRPARPRSGLHDLPASPVSHTPAK